MEQISNEERFKKILEIVERGEVRTLGESAIRIVEIIKNLTIICHDQEKRLKELEDKTENG